jgi:predicted RNA-binding protein with PIN domain
MDGHNMIFALPALQRLQVSGRREEARADLSDRLEQFAIARGEKVLVVFDGRRTGPSAHAAGGPLLEVIYTRPGEGVADERILREARTRSERGILVTVVTNDIATLASRLPKAVRHVRVEEFWRRHVERPTAGKEDGDGGKPVGGDFSDLEHEMLRRAALEEPAPEARTRAADAGSAPKPAAPDRIALKRERGRLRQERRLKRRATPARRT